MTPKPKIAAVIEYLHREAGGTFWLDIHVDRQPYAHIPFATEAERQAAKTDMLNMMRDMGAKDMPAVPQ